MTAERKLTDKTAPATGDVVAWKGERHASERKLPPLPKVGPICYASANDIVQYKEAPDVGRHIPGVRDVALWSTDQMRAYAHAAREHDEALLRQAREALQASRDDVSDCMGRELHGAGYPRYDRRIAAYKEQIEKHDAAIAALDKRLAKS